MSNRLLRMLAPLLLMIFAALGLSSQALAQAVTLSSGTYTATGPGQTPNGDGGPFTPPTRAYTLTNNSIGNVTWTASEDIFGMNVSPTSGLLTPGQTASITLSINSAAGTIPAGQSRTGELTVRSRTISGTNIVNRRKLTINTTKPPEILVTVGNFNPTGPVGGPFAPTFRNYRIENIGDAAVSWTATEGVRGVDVTPSGGALQPGQVVFAQARITSEANTIAPGTTISGRLDFRNRTNGRGNTNAIIELKVLRDGKLEVADTTGYTVRGQQGQGPFLPATKNYVIKNIGLDPLNYTVSENINGMGFGVNGTGGVVTGTLNGGATRTITIAPNSAANGVVVGTPRNGTLRFEEDANDYGNTTRPLQIIATKPGNLTLSPGATFRLTRPEGGFTAFSRDYTISNTGDSPLNYLPAVGSNTTPFVYSTNAPRGTLNPGESKKITMNLNVAAANALTSGTVREVNLRVTDNTNGVTRSARLQAAATDPRAANDDIANAKTISGTGGSDISEPKVRYTMQSGEANHAGGTDPDVASAWWKWVAPETGQYVFDSITSAGDTVIGVYLSPTAIPNVRTLTQVAGADDNRFNVGEDGVAIFTGTKGTPYYIAIASKPDRGLVTDTYTLRWRQVAGNVGGLVAAVLPGARAVQTGTPATAFGTIINTTGQTVEDCHMTMEQAAIGASLFSYQTTDATNRPVGKPNVSVNIPAGGSQGFVFAITPRQNITTERDVKVVFDCVGMAPVISRVGLNTLLLSSASSQPADMVSIADTIGKNGIMDIQGNNGTGFFVAATVNNGGPNTTITASVDTGGINLPVDFTLCQTNASGACVNPTTPATTVSFNARTNTPTTFSIFAKGSGNIAFNPQRNRAFLRFKQGTVTRGATSVAIRTVP